MKNELIKPIKLNEEVHKMLSIYKAEKGGSFNKCIKELIEFYYSNKKDK